MNDDVTKPTLAEAIEALDVINDDHWNKGGAPDLQHLKTVTGKQELTRADVDAVLPVGFNRANAHAAPSLSSDDEQAAEDPIELLERFCSAAQTDRYRRNNGLMNLVRAYQIEQGAIKELQNRLDQRNERRGETNIAE